MYMSKGSHCIDVVLNCILGGGNLYGGDDGCGATSGVGCGSFENIIKDVFSHQYTNSSIPYPIKKVEGYNAALL